MGVYYFSFLMLLSLAVPVIQLFKMLKSKVNINIPIGGYIISAFVCGSWFIHGIMTKDILKIIGSVLGFFLACSILSLAILFRGRTLKCKNIKGKEIEVIEVDPIQWF